jgi:hypothetical protein
MIASGGWILLALIVPPPCADVCAELEMPLVCGKKSPPGLQGQVKRKRLATCAASRLY